MAPSQKLCLLILLLFLFVALLGYLPAIHGVHWFLRVGVPELGVLFLLPCLPAAVWLARTYANLSVTLLTILGCLVLLPWIQAVKVSSELREQGLSPFAASPQRYPLLLGSVERVEVSTEEYKEGLEWDRYRPVNATPTATLLFVHGGSWRNGTRREYSQIFYYLAGRGYEVVSLTYTLSGEAPYPAAPQDVEAAVVKAADFGRPLFLAGRSSGGHLALLASYSRPDKVSGVVGIYPPVDMVWSYEHPSNPNVLNSQEAIVEFLGSSPEEAPEIYEEASPILKLGEQGPPTLLIHGKADCLVYHKQSEMLLERLKALGVESALLSLPWTEHGGDVTIYGPTGRLSVWAMECFIQSVLRESSES